LYLWFVHNSYFVIVNSRLYMEYFMVFLLVVLIIIVLSNVMAINRLAKKSEQDLERFRNEVSGYLRLIIRSQASLTDKLESKPKTTVTEPVREPAPTLIAEKSPQLVIEEPRVVAEVKKVIEPIERKETSQFQPTTEPEFISDFRQHKPAKDNRPFFAKYDGLEDFIGGNLINKIAIGILVLGIAFSLKYAIDKEYINEVGRTIIGVFCGVLLLGIAHRLRKLYAAFSSVLIGGAIATWYFTVAFAFQEYKLFPVEVAFVIMVVVTAIAVTLALVYNRIELALIALLGGFATPLMLNTGQGNYQILFSYIALLNIGMMVLVYFKRWNLVNIVAYISTALLYAGWFFTEYEKYSMALRNDDVTAHFPFMGALLFVSIFYLIFFLMNIIINLKKGETISVSEIIILISNSFLFFVAGIFLLDKSYDAYKGLFTIVLTLFNAGFAFGLYFRPTIDRNLKFLLIGLAASFPTLIAPSQFDGNHITMFWAVEAVLILWFAQVSKIEIIKTGSFVVLIFMFLSMVNDWSVLYVNAPADAIAVKLTVKSFLLLRLAIVLKQFVRFDFTQILVLFSLLH